jgi:hypothetical protein
MAWRLIVPVPLVAMKLEPVLGPVERADYRNATKRKSLPSPGQQK